MLRQIFRRNHDGAEWDAAIDRRKAEYRAEEIKAATGQGRWVARKDMSPYTNVADRLYRTSDGDVHRARLFPLSHQVETWFFPDA